MTDQPKKATRKVRSHNKSGRPDNIVEKENGIFLECRTIEEQLPEFLNGYFIYLRGNNLPASRLEYLREIHAFFRYLTDSTNLVKARIPADITAAELNRVTARDVNVYLDYLRKYTVEGKDSLIVYENGAKTLARKKSSLSVLFKELHREGLLAENIAEGFDPIRVPKAGEHEIKALEDDEVMRMLDAVSTGTGLSPHEKTYWNKTKKRDKAILLLFLTYGLRLSELQQLNLSSFNFSRGEFKIYRKRDKEAMMPLNRSCEGAVVEYIETERRKSEDLPEVSRDALFLSLQGKRMTERQIRELVKKYTSIGLRTSREEGYSPHKLRATAATSLIGRGESIYDVAALLDHEQVTTTQLYAKQRRGVKRDLVRGMEWELERKEGLTDEEREAEEAAQDSALSPKNTEE